MLCCFFLLIVRFCKFSKLWHASSFLNNLHINFLSKCLFHVCSKPRIYNIAWNKMYTVLIIHKTHFHLFRWETVYCVKGLFGFWGARGDVLVEESQVIKVANFDGRNYSWAAISAAKPWGNKPMMDLGNRQGKEQQMGSWWGHWRPWPPFFSLSDDHTILRMLRWRHYYIISS